MAILITGGAGYIGRWLAGELTRGGHDLRLRAARRAADGRGADPGRAADLVRAVEDHGRAARPLLPAALGARLPGRAHGRDRWAVAHRRVGLGDHVHLAGARAGRAR